MHISLRKHILLWPLTLLPTGLLPAQARDLDLQRREGGYDTSKPLIDAHEAGHQHKFQQFVTRPEIDAPRWDITVYDQDALAPGYWFVAPYEHAVQKKGRGGGWVAPHIYDQKGELIWSGVDIFDGFNCFGFVKADYLGQDTMTLVFRHKNGIILDNQYQIIKKNDVQRDQGYDLNMHEFKVVDNGTRLLQMRTMEKGTTLEISQEIGYDGHCGVRYYGFEERDATTMEHTFTWLAEGHVPLSESKLDDNSAEQLCNHGDYDYIHCNSIDKFPDGDFLLGCRHTDTIYKVSHKDGSLVWRFGGKNTDFDMGDAHFGGQHDTRLQAVNETHVTISMLDNAIRPGANKISNDYSRGILWSLNTETMKAEALGYYDHPNLELINGRGSMQVLPNGNVLCGFSEYGTLGEYDADGTLLMRANLRSDTKSFRDYKFEWVGHPIAPPDVYAATFLGNDTSEYSTNVWVSWNGATEVVTWNFYEAKPDGSKELIASTPRQGFETGIMHDGYVSHVVAEALDRQGDKIGESLIVKTVGPAAILDGLDANDVAWVEEHTAGPAVKLYENPIVAFVSGIVLCGLAMLVVGGIWMLRKWRPTPKAWWKTAGAKLGSPSSGRYEQVLKRHTSEEDFALEEPFDLEDEEISGDEEEGKSGSSKESR